MDQQTQIAFVKDLSATIAGDIERSIRAGKVPSDWDGHELRVLLAQKHAASASMSYLKSAPRGKRALNFRNAVIVNNL